MTAPLPPPGDAHGLTRALVAVDSRNPSLAPGAPGEAAVAQVLAETLAAWGFRVDLMDALPGRPNVVARVGGGGGGGRSLILNGHLDTIGVEGMVHAPWSPEERDGRLYGRGSTDMKAGVAAMCAAAWHAAGRGLAGEVIVTAVADEEYESHGTRALIAAGVRADAAIVTEPTRLAVCPAHRGFTWADVTVHGRAAHGSRYDVGIDAITLAGRFLGEVDDHQEQVLTTRTHPLLGRASVHASTVQGGIGISTYPDRCTLSLERRTLPGERAEDFAMELRDAVSRVAARHPTFRADISPGFSQAPNDVPVSHPIVTALADALRAEGRAAPVEGLSCWTDAALLSAAGIPAICFGPGDIALAHAAEEWVSVEEIHHATATLTRLITGWCGTGARS